MGPSSSRTSASARILGGTPHIRSSNLIDIQKSSYDKFSSRRSRRASGTRSASSRLPQRLPIKDFNGTSELVFVSYNLEKPKYTSRNAASEE